MRVRATRADTPVPREGTRRHPITAADPVIVPDSVYYRRRVARGELEVVPEPRPTPVKPAPLPPPSE